MLTTLTMKKVAQLIFGVAAMILFVAATPPIRYNIYTTGTVAQVDARIALIATNSSGGMATNAPILVAGSGITIAVAGLSNTISLYTAPVIDTFAASTTTYEVGATATSTKLDWTLSGGAITSQAIDNGIGAINVTNRTYTHTDSYTTARTYTLAVTDGTTTDTATTTISFRHYRYWGVSANAALDDAGIIALSKEFSTTRVKGSFSVSPDAQYIYYACPASFGEVSFTVNGLPNTAWTLVTRDFTNASAYVESFNIYRSDTILTGTYLITAY